MPNYDYVCAACERKLSGELTVARYEELACFETCHSISPSPKELKEATTCPRCGGSEVRRYYLNHDNICYIRGNGYLDRAGCHRDMNLHRLETEDPYASMRQPGEVDDLKARLKLAGQHDPKPKHFCAGGLQKAVKKVAATKES